MKSIITCDLEGKILTMNDGAEKLFGYSKEELINKKRVSIFSPGEIVLQNVANWLETAVTDGEYIGKTLFINKNKEKINAKIKITPTYKKGKKGEHIGYCGVTEKIDTDVNVKINFTTKIIKWLAITRLPFTSASLLPIFVIASYFSYIGDNLVNIPSLIFCSLGILFAHIGTNMYNDYFDNLDGTDEKNNEYFQQLSGGSRAIELGLITLEKTKTYAKIFIIISLLMGLLILFNTTMSNMINILIISSVGLFLGYFYTSPPLRLVSRKGLGELSIFLAFGPLLTLGTGFAIFNGELPNEHLFNCILLGIPIGLLTTNILLINQFPDMISDAKTNKNHLVVVFGKKKSRLIYLSILIMTILTSFLISNLLDQFILIPTFFLLIFGIFITKYIYKNYNKRELIKANWNTIILHALYCILLILTLLII
ncbi:MAG: hypothetical protein CMD02_02125 [Flavobacteriales bacterium]|nr:hypothetical protein [Flavobacteriales bacterium]|tara:strand:+ start:13659 stop:14936 length:1278 start_codon:yes stop_codon:yes gene_type:complete